MGNTISLEETEGKISFLISGERNPFPLSSWIYTDGYILESNPVQIRLYVDPKNKDRLEKKLKRHKIFYS